MNYENNGVEVYPINVHTICPIAYADDARTIASDWLISIHNPQEQVLAVLLRPIGELSPTHIWCSRVDYCHGIQSQLAWLANQNLDWIDSNAKTISEHLATELKAKFLTIVGNTESDVLNHLGLEVVE